MPAIRPHGLARVVFWLAPRLRDPGWIAFALNRLTGAILVVYLLAHMVVLSRLAAGPSGWDDLLAIFGSQPFLVGDVLLIAAVVFHGLNGARVAALTAGYGVAHSGLSVALVIAASAGLTALVGWGILLR
jgi:Succinate dehydrogenase/Fumarate reductase transmembrane subunit.